MVLATPWLRPCIKDTLFDMLLCFSLFYSYMLHIHCVIMPAPSVGALSDDARLTSVAYIGPKSRTERPTKTKIGTEVAHVTLTQTSLSRSKGQRSTCRGGGILLRPPAHLVFGL